MTTRRDNSYIWVTWITGLLSADKHCEWSAWFRAHHQGYAKVPSDFDLATWKAAHGEMVRVRADELRAGGWTVYVEDQNKFSLAGKAATLGGVADIVAIRGGEGLVVDCKSGKQRDSDAFQVLTYMLVLPHTHKACKDVAIAGEVQYRETSLRIEPDQLTDEMRWLIRGVIECVGGPEPPAKVPSLPECRFCDLTAADCPERVEQPPAAAAGPAAHDLF
jgi:hypothetical protein